MSKLIKKIMQEHRTGCGIACVSMLAGVTYSETISVAYDVLGWEKSQRTFYTTSSQLYKLLLSFNILSKKSRTAHEWASLPAIAIAAINFNERTNNWHWVIFLRELGDAYVIDPRSKHEVRRDFGRMQLRSYIPIELTTFDKKA